MNIFSNIGVTELIVILLLALLVVGPERLPEFSRKFGKLLRDMRKMYENLTRDLGSEIASIQQPIQELRDSVESIRSIPKDLVQTVVKAAALDETMGELKDVTGNVKQVGQALSDAGKAITNPVGAALDTAKAALGPKGTAAKAEPREAVSETQPLLPSVSASLPDSMETQARTEDAAELRSSENGGFEEKPQERTAQDERTQPTGNPPEEPVLSASLQDSIHE